MTSFLGSKDRSLETKCECCSFSPPTVLQNGDSLLSFFPSLLLFSAKSDQEFAKRLKLGEKYLSVSKYHSITFALIKSEALLPAYYVADKVKTKFETFLIAEETNAVTGQRT